MPSDDVAEPKPSSAPRSGRDFDTTRLSLIRQAKQLDQQALAALCEVYWQPVYWFVRSRGAGEELALDVTQGVFEGLLRRDLRTLDLERGKRFRAWLRRVALSHLCNVFKQRNRVSARERSMDQMLGAGAELGADDDTERAFDRRAAEVLVERAWQQLRQEAGVDLRLFEHIRQSLMWEDTELSDLELCRALGQGDSYVRANRCRLKKTDFPRALRAELARVGVSKRHMNDELRALLDALA